MTNRIPATDARATNANINEMKISIIPVGPLIG